MNEKQLAKLRVIPAPTHSAPLRTAAIAALELEMAETMPGSEDWFKAHAALEAEVMRTPHGN